MLKSVKNALLGYNLCGYYSASEILRYATLSEACSKRQAVKMLVRFFDTEDGKGKLFAISVAGSMRHIAAHRFLIWCIEDKKQESPVRDWAVNQFWRMPSGCGSPLVPALIRIAKTETDDDVMRSIVYTVAWFLNKKSIVFLIAQISNDNLPDYIRALAAEGLGKVDEKVPKRLRKITVKALIQRLDDSSPLVRFFCVRALGWIGDKRALKVLKRLPEEDFVCEYVDGGTMVAEVKQAKKYIRRKRS